jgi:hypothetical protein
MARYDWGINGQAFDMSRPGALQLLMAEGQRVRVIFANTTTMYHPMHIHGHTFQLGPAGPRKDTVIVRPGQQVACDFDAANPGQWMTHCHNLYHAPQGGMMAMFSYQTWGRRPRGPGRLPWVSMRERPVVRASAGRRGTFGLWGDSGVYGPAIFPIADPPALMPRLSGSTMRAR